MIYLRIRTIEIDVIPSGEPFIRLIIDRITENEAGETVQTVGNFDRIYKRLSDIAPIPVGSIADDGYIDPLEMYRLIAGVTYHWVMQKHGGEVINNKLVIG